MSGYLIGHDKQQGGFSILEAIISITAASIIVVVLGSMTSMHVKLQKSSELKDTARAFAVESMEIVSGLKNNAFACICSSDDCTSVEGVCTRSVDAQSCALDDGYTSCWTRFAIGLTSNSNLHIEDTGSAWELQHGVENITSDPRFVRSLSIENLKRDSQGTLDLSGDEDLNSKMITVTVTGTTTHLTKTVHLSKLLNGWESL